MKRFSLAATMVIVLAVLTGPAQAQLKFNPNQVAFLRWDRANQTAFFPLQTPVGPPSAAAFDGAYVWVAETVSNTYSFVYRLRATDGASGSYYLVANNSFTQLAV